MKYLKLFEAFEAQALSKVLKFLSKKVGKESSSQFKDSLKRIMDIYNIPIDKIKEYDVKYLSKKQAVNINSEEDVSNPYGIYCIKFWFSLEKGFIGYTGVGNSKINFENWKKNRGNTRSKDEPLDEGELNYIESDLGIKTGLLKPIKLEDYQDLQTGDEVIAYWSEYVDIDRLGPAKIWRDGDNIYGIQDISSGGAPNNIIQELNGVDIRWRDLGPYSWDMGTVNYPADDHVKLHRYIRNQEPISIYGVDRTKKEKEKTESIYDFNLPISQYGELTDWGNSRSVQSYESIEQSDFCIVFYIDNMLDPDKSEFYETPTDIKKQRAEDREGATKLLSDTQIKRMNIERYLKAAVSKMGIDVNPDFQNLQNIIKTSTGSDYAFFSLLTDYPSLDFINDFSSSLIQLLRSSYEDDKEYYIKRAANIYKNAKDSREGAISRYKESMDIINSIGDEETKKFMSEIMNLSGFIKSYIESQNIKTIEDLKMLYHKLRSVRALILDSDFRFSFYRNLIEEIFYPSDVKRACEQLKGRNNDGDISEIEKDNKKLKNIEKYIKSILV